MDDSYTFTVAFKCDGKLRAAMDAAADVLGQSISTLARVACTLAYLPLADGAPPPEPEDLDFAAMRARREKMLADIAALDAEIETRYAAVLNRAADLLSLEGKSDAEKLEAISKTIRREVTA